MSEPNIVQALIEGVLAGRTDILSKAITLIESRNRADKKNARALLEACVPKSGRSLRIAISGAPGVGKSTFINALGQEFLKEGKKVAVLAIDPSSERTRGSILGDKTRMAELSIMENVFIRPSPSSGALGGIARNTYETMLLCEAAGFDLIVIETVGVGQSETAVSHLVDLFVLLLIAGAGDELQGIKRGIMEQADLIVLNKIDSADPGMVRSSVQDLKNALHLFPANENGLTVQVRSCSSATGTEVPNIASEIFSMHSQLLEQGTFQKLRGLRSIELMRRILKDGILEIMMDKIPANAINEMEEMVGSDQITAYQAVDRLLDNAFRST